MKKIIYILGILFLGIVIILNLLFTANLDTSEHITIELNNIIYIIGLVLGGILIYFGAKTTNKYLYDETNSESKSKIRKDLLFIAIFTYILFSIVWIIVVRPPIVADQIHVCNLAQTFYTGNLEEFLPKMTYAGIPLSQYIQSYSQQITLAFVFNIFFRIIHSDCIELLRVLNVISNILIVIAILKICKQLSKKYKTNKVLLLTLILTFVSIPMLSTFVYGDIPSMALCLFSVYFMMEYTETKKIKYSIFASVLTMLAYMMRMNSLIFIIATVIYLLLNLFKSMTKNLWKENLLNVLIIIIYIFIAIIPSSLIKNYYLNQYNLDKNKSYPSIGYLLMGMQEGPRGNGWYNENIANPALKNPESIKDEYVERVKERLNYFSENIGYTFKFYTMKVASMWTENTYSAVRNNAGEENDVRLLTFYQKILLIITCLCSLIVLIQNRKNLSIDVIFLLTIFIGGFAFHILWEAKSRYIIPYIVILIPIAAININKFSIKETITNYSKK